MMNTTDGHTQAATRTSPLRAAPLPESPGAPSVWPDRASRLREQANVLGVLIREDLSLSRALAFLLCAGVVTLVAGVVPAVVIDAAVSDTSEATDVAVAAVLGVLLIAVLAVPALLVLRALRKRSARRFELLRQWAAVDRGHDSEFPARYGTQGYPHGRFFYAGIALVLLVALGAAVLAGLPDPNAFAALPVLVVAGASAWNPIRKYAGRYSWSERERVIRARARRRELHRAQLAHSTSGGTEAPVTLLGGERIHSALLYAAVLSPAVIVTLVFVVVRPENVLGIALAGLVTMAILVLGLPKVILTRRRERAELVSAANSVTSAFTAGTLVYPVRYGLGEPDGQAAGAAPAAWDLGPSRTGALTVDAGTLRLRGVDGAALDLPIAEVQGAVFLASGVAWLAPSVDVLLPLGEAVEFRSPEARAIVDSLAGAGVRVVTP